MRYPISVPSKHFTPILASLANVKPSMSHIYKFKHVSRFRQKYESRVSILNQIIPEEFKLSDYFLLHTVMFYDDFNLIYKDQNLIKVEKQKVLSIGSDLLILRLFDYLIKQHSGSNNPIDVVSCVDPLRINTFSIRHEFINQFNRMLDSKDSLDKYQYWGKIDSIKIEKKTRHKSLLMLIGLIYFQHGLKKSTKFINEWCIKGRWSRVEKYNHKGLVEIYTDKKMNIF
ncbi:uncharacterized protein C5L36_0A12455 [Pichia kudriavzevii]|uniref:RNase III domain-containing protein n=1 Tax=Pichia kudriavzevii TaxID=4909 RepID=A0A1V2LHS1_PICKU|nr:uncharacterized protein C5L36_0A12455 [Pichia kudriavzevii]AWU76018.1 hypothetical protein C5L36_0A12455 [Pichia kudriavzevii]ONH71858.1 hypothetical protein BOH78_4201 [Pichia kudriavzevii]